MPTDLSQACLDQFMIDMGATKIVRILKGYLKNAKRARDRKRRMANLDHALRT